MAAAGKPPPQSLTTRRLPSTAIVRALKADSCASAVAIDTGVTDDPNGTTPRLTGPAVRALPSVAATVIASPGEAGNETVKPLTASTVWPVIAAPVTVFVTSTRNGGVPFTDVPLPCTVTLRPFSPIDIAAVLI